jgi:hypothetical protein
VRTRVIHSTRCWIGPNRVATEYPAITPLPLAVLVPDDREHQSFLNLGAQCSQLTSRKRVNRVIQRGTEVLDGIADQDADAGRRSFLDLRPANGVARLGVYLTADGVGIRPEPVIDSLLDGFYVFTSPIDLQPRAVQR